MNGPEAANRRFLDVEDVANEYGLAVSTVYTMVSQRRIPFVKMGRRTKFDRKELDRWIHSHSFQPLGQKRT